MDRRYQRYEDYFTFSDSSVIYNEQAELAAQVPFSGNRNVGVPVSQNQNAMTTTSRELESFESENGRLGLQQRKFSDMIPRMQGMGGDSMESGNLNITGSQIRNTTSGMQVRAADAQSHEWSRNVDLEMCTNKPQTTQHEFEDDRLERTEPYQMHKMSVEYNAEESYDSTLPRREPAYQQKQAFGRVSDNTVFSDSQNTEQDHFWRDDYDNTFNQARRHEGYPQLGRERDDRFLPNQDHYHDQDMHAYDKDIQQGGFNSYGKRWSSQRNEKPYDSSEYNTPQDYQSDGLEMPVHERWDYSREGNYSSQPEWQTNKASGLQSRGRYPSRVRGQFSRNGQHFRGEEFFRGQRHQNKRGKFPPRGHTLLPKQNQTRGRGSHRGSRAHPGQGRGRGRGQSKQDQLKKQPYGGKQKSASQEKAALMETSSEGHQNFGNKPEHIASNEKEKTVTSPKELHTKNMDLQSESPNSGEKSVEVDEKPNTRTFENQSGSVKSEERDALNSAKQDVQPDEKDVEDAEDVGEEDTSFCKLCAMSFDSSEKYFRHTRGLLHTQRLMAQDIPELEVSDTQNIISTLKEEPRPPISQVEQVHMAVRQKTAKLSPSSVQKNASADTSQGLALINSSGFDEDDEFEDEENLEETFAEDGAVDKEGDFEEFRCKLCDVKTTGPVSMRAHLSGKSHKMIQEAVEKGFPVPQRVLKKIGPDAQVPHSEYKPSVSLIPVSGPSILVDTLRAVPEAIVGLPAVREYQLSKQPSFTCTLCDAQCDLSSIQTHIIGSKHRMKYLKTNHPDIYEHVKAHGGKKSQLSAFLEEVCSDIESKEGRGVPLVQKPAAKESTEKEEGGEAEDSQESSRAVHKEDDRGASSAISSVHTKRLPHDIIVARYKEERRRREMDEQSFGHFEGGRGRGRYPGPPDALSYYEGARGHGRPYDDYKWLPDRPPGPPFGERWGREGDWDRGPEPPFYGPPGRYPYWDNRPRGFSDEEERIRRMYEYERHAFYHPAVGISRQEEQHRMMFEYERLGIPYEEARRRMMMQDDRRMRLSDMVRSGMPMDEARQRIMAEENRVLLLQEYERQGLSAREARHRIIVEEERQKLLDEYERRGITAMEARKRIASGDIRLHFTREFERRGMTLEEARMQTFREEEHQQRYLELYYGDVQPRNPYRRQEPPLSEAALLKRHLQQGLKLEDAKNKVIACLRAEGIPTHEAILRVEKIEVTPDMLQPEENRRSLDDRERGGSCREAPKHMVRVEDEDKMQAKIRKFAEDDLDSISVDEAKERLLQEYMRRGVPREEARQSLISELIRQGVSPEEARRRFRDPPKAYQSGNHSPSPDSSHKTDRRDRSRRSRSRSSSDSSSPSRVRDYTKRSRSFCTEEREKGRKLSRESQASERSKGEKHHGSRETYSERKHRVPDCEDPPTLTLGEELKRMKMKRRLEAYEKELAQKQAKTSTSSSSASETPSTSTFSKIKLHSQPKTSPSDPGPKTDVKELLENLTNNLISSEDDAAAALQVSKALTSALLKYRFKATPNEEASKSQQSLATFPERRISDVKKTA